jgi:hypothetical protein
MGNCMHNRHTEAAGAVPEERISTLSGCLMLSLAAMAAMAAMAGSGEPPMSPAAMGPMHGLARFP